MQFSKTLNRFEPEIFAALNDKKIALEKEGRTIYNLSVGTPDFETPAHIKQALIDAAKDQNNWKYSLRDSERLVSAVQSYYKKRFDVALQPDEIQSCNGSQDGLGHIGMVLCDEGDTVLLPSPCYPAFITTVKMCGAEPYFYPMTKETGFLPKVWEIPEDVAKKAKFMIVSLPSNPMGSIGTPELYEEIIAFEVKAFIANIDEGSISKAGFSIGAINLAEAKFNYESALTRYAKEMADAEAEEGGKQK